MKIRPLELWINGKQSAVRNHILSTCSIPISGVICESFTPLDSFDYCKDYSLKAVQLQPTTGIEQGTGFEQHTVTDILSQRKVGIKLRYTASNGHIAQAVAMSLVGSVEYIFLEFADFAESRMIPVENLVAACSSTGTKLAVYAQSAAVIPGLAFALDLGVDVLVLPAVRDKSSVCFSKETDRASSLPLTTIEGSVASDGIAQSGGTEEISQEADEVEEVDALWEAAAIALAQRGERSGPMTESGMGSDAVAVDETSALSISPAIVSDVTYGKQLKICTIPPLLRISSTTHTFDIRSYFMFPHISRITIHS
jgi:hypothetical protein